MSRRKLRSPGEVVERCRALRGELQAALARLPAAGSDPAVVDAVWRGEALGTLLWAVQLAELLDGKLTLAPTPGGGCTFLLSLPVTPTSAAPAPRAAPDTAEAFPGVRARPVGFGYSHVDTARARSGSGS